MAQSWSGSTEAASSGLQPLVLHSKLSDTTALEVDFSHFGNTWKMQEKGKASLK